MSREMQKGAGFEQDVADFMADRLGDERIERRVKHGANDRGDISGLYVRGKRTVVECKNHKRMELSKWVDEAETERGNDDAEFGIVVHKRKGHGKAKFGGNYVTMTLDTFCAMVAGSRWHLNYTAEERECRTFMLEERGMDHDG